MAVEPPQAAVTMRDLCLALQNKTYFNYGGQGPLPSMRRPGDNWHGNRDREQSKSTPKNTPLTKRHG